VISGIALKNRGSGPCLHAPERRPALAGPGQRKLH
jgi:hypothetical protein